MGVPNLCTRLLWRRKENVELIIYWASKVHGCLLNIVNQASLGWRSDRIIGQHGLFFCEEVWICMKTFVYAMQGRTIFVSATVYIGNSVRWSLWANQRSCCEFLVEKDKGFPYHPSLIDTNDKRECVMDYWRMKSASGRISRCVANKHSPPNVTDRQWLHAIPF